ncbi:MAG: prepilin-type N-terminal cleavage/methylation domain-containing protein [Candidatus Berkelbacteria bacterium]|nr:prepilin-type N-terminal cleavage/methylation domain-containing protein [Candidatus Berkelbacteria bacterium]
MKRRGAFTLIELPVVSKRAFTLIELLIVIAIISIVSVFIIVSVRNAQSRARDVQRVADLAKINSAVQLYYRENGFYPPTLNVLVSGKYLTSIPTDPKSGTYKYLLNSAGVSCYKILITSVENPTLNQYKSIIDEVNPAAWSVYSLGCKMLH